MCFLFTRICCFLRENGLEPGLESYSALLCNYGETGDMDAINRVSGRTLTLVPDMPMAVEHSSSLGRWDLEGAMFVVTRVDL